ncbi:hypothetical protein ACTWP4_01450 [Gracilibacillus sp. D59]|uniref:hypothetical protein n=1 Tax=Gracilibacillus sp. D59 TaxID=3457434 RepID=UPI003FCD407C
MFRKKIYITFVFFFILFLVGCEGSETSEQKEDNTNTEKQEEEVVTEKEVTEASTQTKSKADDVITVKKQVGDANKYEDFQEITGETLTELVNVFETLDWELGVIDLEHSPKYQLNFKLSDAERKTYLLYLYSDHSGFTLVEENGARYVTLDHQNRASKIYKIISGKELTVAK